MKLTTLFALIILLTSFVLADCESDQVDINTASLSELDKLTGIGSAKGQAIIDTRPYSTLDDLIDVSGIGDVTLQKIKDQGIACIDDEETEKPEEKNKEVVEEKIIFLKKEKNEATPKEDSAPEKIILASEAIKDFKIPEKTDKDSLKEKLPYAFSIFLISLLFLVLKNR